MENGLGAQSGDNWEEKKREFELNRGFAVDTLLADYASLFDSAPNFDIFDDRVILKDTQVCPAHKLARFSVTMVSQEAFT